MDISKIKKLQIVVIFITTLFCFMSESKADDVSDKIHIFYYPWYGNIEIDGEYRHWDHEILNNNDMLEKYPGGLDIGANYYPQLGCYSSNDTSIINAHMEMISGAGVGVVVISWWGIDSFEDKTIPLIMEIAEKYGVKIAFHIEPFAERDALNTKVAIQYIIDNYGSHPAFYRTDSLQQKPFFYIYDSYKTPTDDWSKIFGDESNQSIRGTDYDAIVVGLLLDYIDFQKIEKSGFDGFYTYFATDGFSYASTITNWKILSNWAEGNHKIYIPCVGPGYIDTRIRPWNAQNIRNRNDSDYYDRMFTVAIKTQPEVIGITSFNEWHEGTQIEPAISQSTDTFVYKYYGNNSPDYYLNRTAFWIDKNNYYLKNPSELEKLHFDFYQQEFIDHLTVNKSIVLTNPPSNKYSTRFGLELVDGIIGTENYKDGNWIGFEFENLVTTIDLGDEQLVSSVEIRFINNPDAWIFPPENISIYSSQDSTDFKMIDAKVSESIDSKSNNYVIEYSIEFSKLNTRYIKMIAENIKYCPPGHPGEGGNAWIFADEIIIK